MLRAGSLGLGAPIVNRRISAPREGLHDIPCDEPLAAVSHATLNGSSPTPLTTPEPQEHDPGRRSRRRHVLGAAVDQGVSCLEAALMHRSG